MAAPRWIGRSLRRLEDPRLLTGTARFIEDYSPLPGIAHAAILRSYHAHALIRNLHIDRAVRQPGVIGVLTAEQVRLWARPFPVAVDLPIRYFPLATERVRYVGEPVAVVVAESPAIAEDALHMIEVEYEPLPTVVDPEEACQGTSVLLHPEAGTNVASRRIFRFGDPESAFRRAELIVCDSFVFSRHTCLPLETYGVIAHWESGGRVTIWANFHGPFVLKTLIAQALGLPDNAVRVIVPADIGGSFGIKAGLYPYMTLIALASRLVGRPVKWIEKRREHLIGSSFGAGRVSRIEGAFTGDGLLLGLRYQFIDDVGAYARSPEPANLYRCFGNLVGPYAVKNLAVEMVAVMTNKPPTGLNRGFGGPQLYFSLESVMDIAAEKLELDPVEIRRRNLIRRENFPYTTPSGGVYESGDYEQVLERLVEISRYDELREEQAKARRQGRLMGIGVAVAVDPSGTNIGYIALARTAEQRRRGLQKSGSAELASISLDPLGNVTVRLGSCPQGQGHETVAAQVVAEELGVKPEEVRVLCEMDSLTIPWTITTGSYSSRFAPLGTSALVVAARRVREKLRKVAAVLLEAAEEDVEVGEGEFYVRGTPERRVPWRRAAGALHWDAGSLTEKVEAGVDALGVFEPGMSRPADPLDRMNSSVTYGFVADLAVVEIDAETFEVKVREYFSVHDAGRILNPKIVEGQVYGALAHGIGMALKEAVVHDEAGQPLTGTLAEYACVRAGEMPRVKVEHIETPSPVTLLGAKGVGEAHTMSAPAAVANAIADALRPWGVRPRRLPVTASWIFGELKRKGGVG